MPAASARARQPEAISASRARRACLAAGAGDGRMGHRCGLGRRCRRTENCATSTSIRAWLRARLID
ncbi:hypothetical protein F9948_30845 [Burkholderia thailandensis]|nr:hypothetical protein A8H32_07475 [Burkholderia thailandensis]MDD1484457.1 hypothetical protein [Burkholderia thailandensis]